LSDETTAKTDTWSCVCPANRDDHICRVLLSWYGERGKRDERLMTAIKRAMRRCFEAQL